jgi:hypothetical protein
MPRVNAAAKPGACLEYDDPQVRIMERACRSKPGGATADHDDVSGRRPR